MSFAKAIAEAIAGGIAGYATAKSGTDFINPLLAGQQKAQDRKARKDEIKFKAEVEKANALELARERGKIDLEIAEKRGKIEADTQTAIAKMRGDQERETALQVAQIRVDSGKELALIEAGIRAEEADKSRAFTKEQSQDDREFTLKRDERIQAAKTAEAELQRAHEVFLADQSNENRLALLEKEQAFQSTMEEVRQAGRLELQREAQEFQSEEANTARKFDAGMTVFRETGDMGALSSALGLIPGGESLFENISNRVVAATKAVQDRDQRQVDTYSQSSSAQLDALTNLAKTSPTQFLEVYEAKRGQMVQEYQKVREGLALEGNQVHAASMFERANSTLDSLKHSAEVTEAQLTIDAGNYEPLGDTDLTPSQRSSVIRGRYGKGSAQQEGYKVGTAIVGRLDNFNHVKAEDIEDLRVKELVGILQSSDPEAALADHMMRNADSAAGLGELMDNLSVGELQNESDRLGRLETKRGWEAKLNTAAETAGERFGKDFDLPADAFIVEADTGQIQLSADGAQSMAKAIESQFDERDGNPTWSSLQAVDKLAAIGGWDESMVSSIKSAIVSDYQYQEQLALQLGDPAEAIGSEVMGTFSSLTPKVAAELKAQTVGMGPRQAKERIASLGYDPSQLEVIKEGGSVYGKQIVESVVPGGAGAEDLIKRLEQDLDIAVAGPDASKVTDLQNQLATLQAVKGDASVISMAKDTMFDATRAVAYGQLEELYDKVTRDAKNRGILEGAVLEDGEDPAKAEFVAYVEQGATEGARVQRAIDWLNNNGMFQLGTRTQAATGAQQKFNAFLASYADDYGERLDDVLASIDLGADYNLGTGGFLGFNQDRDTSDANVALRYLTSTSAEVGEFLLREDGAAREDKVRARVITPPKPEI